MNKVIPNTDSIEYLAGFWDMHDLTDFEEQLEEVPEPIFEYKMQAVVVPLHPREVVAVKRIAKFEGIEYSTLIRNWILEKLPPPDASFASA